ncbi:MAG: GNAT family N-acetyltransferase [Candidatus Aenigmatarchaeota archaeon]
MKEIEISGEKVTLKKLKEKYTIQIYKNLQDKEIVKWTLIPWPYKKRDAFNFVKTAKEKLKKREAYTFGIFLKGTDKLVGCISLKNVSKENKNGELGYWIGRKYWNKGYATEAVKLILHFAFKKLKLHKVYAVVLEENIASVKVLEKNGFRIEGEFREQRFRYKKWHDELRFGILKNEWKKLANKINN